MKKERIRAAMTPAALARAAGLLEADTAGIVAELFENARRAGAGAIEVWTSGDETVFTDDGAGLADPGALLRAGASAWGSAAVRGEEPAGLGLYALAGRGCRITTREAGGPGRTVTIEPRHFRGEAAAQVQRSDDAPSPHGTEVAVRFDGAVDAAVARAARHLPVEVILNGTRVEQGDFLDGAVRTEQHAGVRIGVFRGWREAGDVNFLGRVLREPCLPRIGALARDGARSETWSVRIDAVQPAGIRLDRRKERLVGGEWLHDVQRTARTAIYRAIGEAGDVRLDHAHFAEAETLEVRLQPPAAELPPWRATPADRALATHELQGESAERVRDDAVVMEAAPADPADQAAFELALARAKANGAWKATAYRAVPEYDGYDWYDRLPKVTGVHAEIEAGSGDMATADLTDPDRPRVPAGRPARMSLRIEIERPRGGRSEALLDLDLLFGSTAAHGYDPWASSMLLRAGASIRGDEIAACCLRGCYDPEGESGPWEARTVARSSSPRRPPRRSGCSNPKPPRTTTRSGGPCASTWRSAYRKDGRPSSKSTGGTDSARQSRCAWTGRPRRRPAVAGIPGMEVPKGEKGQTHATCS